MCSIERMLRSACNTGDKEWRWKWRIKHPMYSVKHRTSHVLFSLSCIELLCFSIQSNLMHLSSANSAYRGAWLTLGTAHFTLGPIGIYLLNSLIEDLAYVYRLCQSRYRQGDTDGENIVANINRLSWMYRRITLVLTFGKMVGPIIKSTLTFIHFSIGMPRLYPYSVVLWQL